MPTGYGSPIYAGHRPRRDAACVAMGRKAGGWPWERRSPLNSPSTIRARRAIPSTPSARPEALRAVRRPPSLIAWCRSRSARRRPDRRSSPALSAECSPIGRPSAMCALGCHGIFRLVRHVGFYARTSRTSRSPRCAGRLEPVRFPTMDRRRTDSSALRSGRGSRLHPAVARRCGGEARARRRKGLGRGDACGVPGAEDAHRVISCREFALNFTREIEHHWEAFSADLRAARSGPAWSRARALSRRAACWRIGAARPPAVFADYDVLLAPAAVDEAPIGWNTGDSTLASTWTLMHMPTMNVPVFKGPNGLPVGAQVIAANGTTATLRRRALDLPAACLEAILKNLT